MGAWEIVWSALAAAVETTCDVVGAVGQGVANGAGAAADALGGEGSGDGFRDAGSEWNDRWRRFGDAASQALQGFFDSAEYALMYRHRIENSTLDRDVDSIPKPNAYCFNTAVANDNYQFNDSGVRFEFGINGTGQVEYRNRVETGESWRLLGPPSPSAFRHNDDYNGNVQGAVAISYTHRRGKGKSPKNNTDFDMYTAPPFDMIAADQNRVIAKEKGKDNFYVLTMVHEYPHYADKPGVRGVHVPAFEFKLDPEYGLDSAVPGDIGWWTGTDCNGHPSVGTINEEALNVLKACIFQDFMMIRAEPRVWHLLDSRPPLGSGKPPRWVNTYNHVSYRDLGILGVVKDFFGHLTRQTSIKFTKVLDIGVGNMHRHRHYETINGGEMQSGPISFFTGHIRDRAGFWDGTGNFYILCQLKGDKAIQKAGNTNDAYGILWIDHQTYFSERWRLVHPSDCFSAIYRDYTQVSGTKTVFAFIRERFRFNRDRYWCPFRSGCIDHRSRMGVSRQYIVVSGMDEIYSINYSWGTMDRTWRLRPYPDAERKYFSRDDIEAGSQPISIDDKFPNSVYPQSIELREDMTILLKGTKEICGATIPGRWYQKVLPAENLEVPDEMDRNERGKPAAGYNHQWHFMADENFARADAYSHFDSFKEIVDSRSQYYEVSFTEQIHHDQLIGKRWLDVNKELTILSPTINLLSLDGPSLFNANTYLTFRNGFNNTPIMIWWDKKDDDLMTLENLKGTVVILESDDAERKQIRLTLNSNILVWQPPVVNRAIVTLEEELRSINILFESRMRRPPRWVRDSSGIVNRNWQESTDSSIFLVKACIREGDQTRDIFAKPKSLFTPEGDFMFFYNMEFTDPEDYLETANYFREPFRYQFGTALVFENILGHVATPEDFHIWIQNS